jgi:hypothetical protein
MDPMNKKTSKLSDKYPAFKRVEDMTKGSNCSTAYMIGLMTEEEVDAGVEQIEADHKKNPDEFYEAMKKHTLKVFGKERIT